MRIFIIVFSLVLFFSCSDNEESIYEQSKCEIIIKDTASFILCDRMRNPLDSVKFTEARIFDGIAILNKEDGTVTYKAYGLNIYYEKEDKSMNDIFFTILENKITFIRSNSIASSFFFEEYELSKWEEDNYDISFMGEKAKYITGYSSDNYSTNIQANIRIINSDN